jgi:hypothetical protein
MISYREILLAHVGELFVEALDLQIVIADLVVSLVRQL